MYWTSEGRGAPPALLCDGLGCDGFIWRYLRPALARQRRVLHFHYRGHGRSPLPPEGARHTVETLADDLVAVLDAARVDRAVLLGHSLGVQVALEAHRRHPDRIAALVLLCGSPGHPLHTFHDSDLLFRVLPTLRRLAEILPGGVSALTQGMVRTGLAMELALLLEVNPKLVHRQDLVPYFEHLRSMDPRFFLRAMEAAGSHTAEDHLPAVDVPTLVVGGDQDRFTPPWLSRRMAAAIPGAELALIEGGSHTTPLEAPQRVERAVADFLRTRVPRSDTRRARLTRRSPGGDA